MKKWVYIVVTVAIVLAVSLFYMNKSMVPSDLSSYDNVMVSQSVLNELHGIANDNALAAGVPLASGLTQKNSNYTLFSASGKPVVLYIGADYCPYCAAARWGLVLALMRFGNFTSLRYMTSSTSDVYPGTPTFTFYNASYYSSLINFTSVELTTNEFNSTTKSYPILQQPDALQEEILSKYDTSGSIPFMDFANVSVSLGSVSPQFLSGMNWSDILARLNDQSSTVAQLVIGPANAYTAAICESINNSADVCSQSYVTKIENAQ